MIFQHFNLLERSTVYDNIAYPLKYTGRSRQEIRSRVKELLELVDAIDHPAVGICLDVGHMHYMREPIGPAIRTCGDKIIAFHIDDNDTWNDSHVPPYCGSIDWEEVYRAVRDINYKGGGMLEFHACWKLPREMQMECLKYMNDLCEFMMEQMGGDQ